MARRYGWAILVIISCVVMMAVPGATGFAKTSKSLTAHKNYASVGVIRAPQSLELRSASVLVEDQRTGEFLIQKRAAAVVPIASITKLMTAMVVLDAQMDLKESLIIKPEDVDTLRHSRSRLSVGARLTREEALLLALMASENRAAHVLGRTYPGGVDAFVKAMNAKAQSLGLAETRFNDPTGLSCGNVSSARNLADMVNAAYNYPLIREFTTRDEAVIHFGRRTLAFHNTNRLVRSSRWQIGLSKTGFIDEAGRCLVMQAQVAQRPVLIILLDAQGKQTRFADANRIKQWMEGPPPSRRTRKG
ncbi:MAG: D-alanyl-D-alanine endopeptidase [Syntrophales bacterium]|jgi:D-alanyl-D-alanine endopeptidase (penicillin-binding protein 7)